MKGWRLHLLAGVLGSAAGLLGVLAFFWFRGGTRPPEKPPEGKPLSALIDELKATDPQVSAVAADELVARPEEAVPVLLEARRSADMRLHRRAVAVLLRIGSPAAPGLVAALRSGEGGGERVETALVRLGAAAVPALVQALDDDRIGPDAARDLGLIGPSAAASISPLLDKLLDPRPVSAEAARALGRIGPLAPEVVPGLIKALNVVNARVRERAAEALGLIGPAARAAVPALRGAAGTRNVEVSQAACWALGRIGDAEAAPVLALMVQRPEVHDAAVRALVTLGPAAEKAIPHLVSLLREPDGPEVSDLLVRLGSIAVREVVVALRDESVPLAQRLRLAEILTQMGPTAASAAPLLSATLEDKEPRIVVAAALALLRVDPVRGLAALPALKGHLRESGVALALGELGPTAAATVPDLIEALKERKRLFRPDRRPEIQWTLARIGTPAVPSLIAAVKEGHDTAAPRAAQVLGWIGPASRDAVPALRDALKRPGPATAYLRALGQVGAAARPAAPDLVMALKDPERRREAALALARIDPARAGQAVTALVADLPKANEAGRRDIVLTLGEMGPPASGAIRELQALLNEGKAGGLLLEPIVWALGEIGPDAADAVPDLILTLQNNGPEVGRRVARTLGRLGPRAVSALDGTLRNRKQIHRDAAAWALGQLGADARDAVPTLARALTDPDRPVRLLAADALAAVGPDAKTAVPALIAALNGHETELRSRCARALAKIGAGAREAVPVLTECLLDPDRAVREESALALGAIGDPAPATVAALVAALADADEAVQIAAAESTARLAPSRVKEVTPLLVALVQSPFAGIRLTAFEALARLDVERAREAVPTLLVGLAAEDLSARLRGARTLLKLDKGISRVYLVSLELPLLRVALWDGEAYNRREAAAALGQAGEAAKEAAPALAAALRDPDAGVRQEAAKALRRVDPKAADEAGVP